MEVPTDPIGLRVPAGFGHGVLNTVNRHIQLVIMRFGFTAIFRSPIGQNTQHKPPIFHIERQDTIIE